MIASTILTGLASCKNTALHPS